MSQKLKKTIRIFLIIFTGVAIAAIWKIASNHFYTNRDYQDIIKSGEINIITTYNSPNYYIENDSIIGFQHDLIHHIFKDKNLKLNITVVSNINEEIDDFRRGKYDLIAGNIIGSKEIKEELALTFPIITNKQVLVQRNDSTNIQSQLDLAKKTLYVIKNSPAIYRIKNLSNEIADTIYIEEIDKYGQEALPTLVSYKDIDYAVCDEIIAQNASDSLQNIDINLAIGFTQFYSWAVNYDSPELLDSLNIWIKGFRKTDEYKKIYGRYYR